MDSAIVKLVTRKWQLVNRGDPNYQLPVTNYYKLVRVLFKQPRKTILNNLGVLKSKKEILPILEKLGINPSDRPQDLSIDEIIKLTRAFFSIIK